MYRSIVVPLDGSPFSEYAVPFAQAIARQSGATLRLIHVHIPVEEPRLDGVLRIDARLDLESREHERSYLEQVQHQVAREAELPATVALLDGPVAVALAEEIQLSDADLVVMTTHGRGGLARMWLGSVADHLLHHVTVPVLLLRPHAPAQPEPVFRKILIPLDGSHLAEQILDKVLELDAARQAEYILLQIVYPFVNLGYHGAAPVPDLDYDITMYRQHEALRSLEKIAQRMRADGRRVQTQVVVEERSAVVILQEAQRHRVDLIALATHGRGGPVRLLVGSVADKVVRGAECPVLVFRPTSPLLASSLG